MYLLVTTTRNIIPFNPRVVFPEQYETASANYAGDACRMVMVNRENNMVDGYSNVACGAVTPTDDNDDAGKHYHYQ